MILLRLAYRNLVGAGLRTWLSVGILSFTYVLIIWHQGLFNGMLRQATRDYVKDEIGGGQYWVAGYDPYDPLTVDDGHQSIPAAIKRLVREKKATPVLIRQGTIYPHGRAQTVLLKGVEPDQHILDIPTGKLREKGTGLPVLIGPIMAKKIRLGVGDPITFRWRDANGTFDAIDGEIFGIMDTHVPTIDAGQLWLPLAKLQEMASLDDEATLIVVGTSVENPPLVQGWNFRNHDFLLKDIRDVVTSKRVGGAFLYVILLFMAMLGIFDTQVLSIFRRRKEIGTLMALGMVRSGVIALFTLEGAFHGVLGVMVAAIYGIPVLIYSARTGIPLPGTAEEYGFALSTRLFPVYSAWLLAGTVGIVLLTVTVVSYLPSRKISEMKPTEALKGKLA